MPAPTGTRAQVYDLVGQSPCMERLRGQIVQVSSHDVNVLIQGESGTGKELVARNIHRLSRRHGGPFIGINCAAIHESLLESELFGHEAGAFTGARNASVGFLRAANGGTMFLDEVGDMSNALQSKLLRVLEERAVVPVGSTKSVPVDIRVIAATHRNLASAVAEGSFRTDLYYRLNVVGLFLSPLRERQDDIPVLAGHLLRVVGEVLKVPVKELSPAAREALKAYAWPGNVRELGNVIQRAYVLVPRPVIEPEDLPPEILTGGNTEAMPFPTLRDAAAQHVEQALYLAGGSRTQAARMLGIDRKTLWRLIRRYKVDHRAEIAHSNRL